MIDYVDEAYGTESDENPLYTANIIANPTLKIGGKEVDAPSMTPNAIGTLQEAGGVEANVATGYHAIEFLLWGQDLNGTGPGAGNRPATDYDQKNCTGGNCDRRAAYLKSATDLLVSDLRGDDRQWTPKGAARKNVEAIRRPASVDLGRYGPLSYGELAGERMKLGLLIHDPEEEHDCFSDNTYNSHLDDAKGIAAMSILGNYTRVDGTASLARRCRDLVKAKDPALDAELQGKLDKTIEAKMNAIVKRGKTVENYDQMIGEGNKAGNAVVQAAIDGAGQPDQIGAARYCRTRTRQGSA